MEYYFTAKHSQSDLLKGDATLKTIDAQAERLGPCKEVVLVSGVDYHGGGTNIAYATTHMHEIWKAKSIDAQTMVTVLDFGTGMRERWVKGTGTEKLSKQKFISGWCLLSKDLQGTVAPVLVPGGGDPGADSISITHVYRHMEESGKSRPGTVTEFSIFSHSWVGGPIMFNTGERAVYKFGGALKEERDPLDHDARFWKDFNPTNMPNLPDFMAAFSATCFIKIWGCLAVTVYRNMINKARKAPNDATLLGVPQADRTDWDTTPPTVYADNRPGIIDYLDHVARIQNYMHTLARISGRPVWGGAPGTGALLLDNGTWNWMYMPEYKLAYRGGSRVNDGPYYKNELNYMKSTLGYTFSADWYMEYK